jgi:hypothetical protein
MKSSRTIGWPGAGELPQLLQYEAARWKRVSGMKARGRRLVGETGRIAWFGNYEINRPADGPDVFVREGDDKMKLLVAVTREGCYFLTDLLQQ